MNDENEEDNVLNLLRGIPADDTLKECIGKLMNEFSSRNSDDKIKNLLTHFSQKWKEELEEK